MKKIISILFVVALIFTVTTHVSKAAPAPATVQEYVDLLKSIDPTFSKSFPRWKVCEPELQFVIYTAFVELGFNKEELDIADIEILAAPKTKKEAFSKKKKDKKPYRILLIRCGDSELNSAQISYNIRKLAQILTGAEIYNSKNLDKKQQKEVKKRKNRDYCYEDIPPENPVSESQVKAIVNFLEPTNVRNSITLSLFDQKLKIGSSGFWLKHKIGTDEMGYPFISSGEAKAILSRPLMENDDPNTMIPLPFLLDIYLGGAYAIRSGVQENGANVSWFPEQRLNANTVGKMVGGLNFNLPYYPQFGLGINLELPLSDMVNEKIVHTDFAAYNPTMNRQLNNPIFFRTYDALDRDIKNIIPINWMSGQFTLHYNWWLDPKNPEQYFRFDVGVNYWEVREFAHYSKDHSTGNRHYISRDSAQGLKLYKPSELGDWLYLKAEFRNQAVWPFDVSFQYSNQILLSRLLFPLFGEWLYLDVKYAKQLRGVMPYETSGFFMISPVLRINVE